MPGSEISQARTKAQELRTAIARKLGGATGPVTVQSMVEELAGSGGTPILRPPGAATPPQLGYGAGDRETARDPEPAPGSERR
jgi:hypothetical protein